MMTEKEQDRASWLAESQGRRERYVAHLRTRPVGHPVGDLARTMTSPITNDEYLQLHEAMWTYLFGEDDD